MQSGAGATATTDLVDGNREKVAMKSEHVENPQTEYK